MAHIRRMTSNQLLAEQAEIILVQPALGGFGESHPLFNKVRIEAVLANPIPELPEIVRLAWLVSQIRGPRSTMTKLPIERAIEIHRLAILPAVLAAAQLVELSQVDEAHVALAIEQWHIPVPAQHRSANNSSLGGKPISRPSLNGRSVSWHWIAC